jgi:hypothetical protein
MTTKYFVLKDIRPTIDDVQFSNAISMQDPTPNDIIVMEEHITSMGGALYGPFDSMQQVYAVQEQWRIDAFKEYTSEIEAALVRGTRRPFLVYINNKPGSDLLVYPGYYGILQQSYAKLQELFDVSLITYAHDNITQIYQVMFVRDLVLLDDLRGIWAFKYHPFVDLDPYGTNKKLLSYMLNWETVGHRALQLAIYSKNPNFTPGKDTAEILIADAKQLGFPDLVPELIEQYKRTLPDDLADIKPYGFKPPSPALHNTKTNETVVMEFVW